MARLGPIFPSWTSSLIFSLALLSAMPTLTYANTTYIIGTDANGITRELADDRYPALYTGQFGDCMGGSSLLNVTAFDAAYYADNMTVLFHLMGTTNLRNDSIMSKFLFKGILVTRLTSLSVYISVEACKEALSPAALAYMLTSTQMERIVLTLPSTPVMLIFTGMSSLTLFYD
jgi:hypothetical protein